MENKEKNKLDQPYYMRQAKKNEPAGQAAPKPKKKEKKLSPKAKKLIPIYAAALFVLGVLPAVIVDIICISRTTAFATGKIGTLILAILLIDFIIWGLAAVAIIMITAIVFIIVRLIDFIRYSLKVK